MPRKDKYGGRTKNEIRLAFYNYEGNMKEFCSDEDLDYQSIAQWLKVGERDRFQGQVLRQASEQMVQKASMEIADKLDRHWQLTTIIEQKILQKMEEDVAEPKSLEQLLRVLQENVKLQRLIMGEPNLITQKGPKSPYESFLARLEAEGIVDAEVEHIQDGEHESQKTLAGSAPGEDDQDQFSPIASEVGDEVIGMDASEEAEEEATGPVHPDSGDHGDEGV